MICRRFFAVAVFLGAFAAPPAAGQFYQGSQVTFGKNRVQYGEFLWTYMRFTDFDVYYYRGGRELAAYVGRSAARDVEQIEQLFDFKASGRMQIIVFNRLSDLKQSNIGLEDEQLENGNIGGVTRVIGDKVLVYFDGNRENLRAQVRAGASRVMMEQLMYGGNIKDRLQSAVLLNLPVWYVEGLSSYIGTGWTVADDNRMRDGILTGRYAKFNRLVDEDEIFAGHSMWHYIVEVYGPGSVANLLYMTRINRNIESGFRYVLGSTLKVLSNNWNDYYQKEYLDADKGRGQAAGQQLEIKSKKKRIISQVRISPDGQTVAYVTNDIGKYRVWHYDMSTGKSTCIQKGGYKSLERINDCSFPLLAWHPSGRLLAMIREHKGQIWLDYYEPGKKKKRWTRTPFFYFEKVTSFSYAPDGRRFVFAGVQKGQSDIFLFNIRARTSRPLTQDRFDDAEPAFLGDRYVMFASNRLDDTLRTADEADDLISQASAFDIYLYDLAGFQGRLHQVTRTPFASERAPVAMDASRFAYMSDGNGIYNRYQGTLDSVISYIDTTEHYRFVTVTSAQTDYARGLEAHDMNRKYTRYAETVWQDGGYRVFVRSNPAYDSLALAAPPGDTRMAARRRLKIKETAAEKPVEPDRKGVIRIGDTPPDSGKIDIANYVFQSEFAKKKVPVDTSASKGTGVTAPLATTTGTTGSDSTSYMLPRQRNYDPAFSADYFVAQLDNSLLNATYQAYTGGAVYFDPGLTGLFKIGISDKMNDYKITGGFRLAGDLNSNEYLLSYENLKRKIDKQVIFFRQAREFGVAFFFVKVHTHELKYATKYPFSDLSSVRASASYRNDRYVYKSTDIIALQIPNFYENWASLKFEYVYDNTLKTGLNLFNGTRLKLFAEGFRQVDRSQTFMGVLGFDIRHYQKVHRQIIWANRLAASTSFGDLKLIYYLGSQDNAIVPTDNFNFDINIDTTQRYAFQTLATPMRGFIQNIRNGNSFAVFNTEIRVPLFQYLIRRPIRSDFIRNFQIVAFGDVGTAWTGTDPYSQDNALNTQIISGNPVTVVLRSQIEPVVAGYGFGLRSRILGYYLKGDWAWGYEDRQMNDVIFYLSLGLDF